MFSTFNWAKPAWNQYSFNISASREGPKVSTLRKDCFSPFTLKIPISFHSISRRAIERLNFPIKAIKEALIYLKFKHDLLFILL